MTQEQKIYAECAKKDAPISLIDYAVGFKRGWIHRIESVYHKPEEKPEESEALLTLNALNIPTLYQRGYLGDWSFLVKEYGIVKWAYIKDLLPEE